MKRVSIFIHFSKLIENILLEEMFNRIKTGFYSLLVLPARQLLAAGDKEGYDKLKHKFPGFTTGGVFDGIRQKGHNIEYSQVLGLDYDDLPEEELIRVKDTVMLCNYTLGCFLSPSGKGLKVFVKVSTGPEEHLKAFLSLQQFYNTLTGVKIDPSGKDITRLCFVSDDPELYYNPAAKVFIPLADAGILWPPVKPDIPVCEGTMAVDALTKELPAWVSEKSLGVDASTGMIETYNRCKAYVGRYCRYTIGQRNDFIFAMACQMSKFDFPEVLTVMMLSGDYDLDASEIRSCVKSAYSYKRGPLVVEENPVAGMADATIPLSQEPPGEPPKQEKQPGRQKYVLKKVEQYLNLLYEMRYNEVKGWVEWRHTNTNEEFIRLRDHHENSMFRKLHHIGQLIPLSVLHVLLTSDYSRLFNPFKDYFKTLKEWDGVTDYIGQLIATVKTTDDDYWEICFRKWFVAYATSLIVAKVINHTVIVFVGIQGVGKTSWMNLLVPQAFKNYVATAALQADSKDTAIQLAECALIILDEMESLNRKDLASFKELITCSVINVRRPYGRNTENMERIASFYAAVNHEQVLTDSTGSRRYLCQVVEYLDYQHTVDIDGAMAQAIALYKSGFQFWFDQNEIKELTDHNEVFLSKSVEEELIETWLRPVSQQEWDTRSQFANSQNILLMNATQIAAKLMEKAKITLQDSTVVKIGRAMQKLKFLRKRKKNNSLYMVRIMESEAVEMNSRTLEDLEAKKAEQQADEQIIRFEQDLTDNSDDGELPF